MSVSATALLNRCAQFNVCPDTPATQLIWLRDAKQIISTDKIIFISNYSLCSKEEYKFWKTPRFILLHFAFLSLP